MIITQQANLVTDSHCFPLGIRHINQYLCSVSGDARQPETMPIDVDIGIRLVVSGWHFAFLGWDECFNALPPGCSRVPVSVI
jgi:hypothetical protein